MKDGSAVANHLTTLTLVLFATSIACGTIYNSDDYGLYDYIRWAYTQYHYYIELDAVACTGCLLDKNEKQRLTGECIPYMAHDGKVYALHSNGRYLNLIDEIGQKISIEKCIVNTLYRFTVRFLLQPILGSFEGAIFVLYNPVSACNSDCWKQEVTINQSTLEEYHAKQDFLLVANNSESMDMIRKYFKFQGDSNELTLVPKNKSQTPVFFSAGINNLGLKTMVEVDSWKQCEPISAELSKGAYDNAELMRNISKMESDLKLTKDQLDDVLKKISQREKELANAHQPTLNTEDCKPDIECPEESITSVDESEDESDAELDAKIKNLTSQLIEAEKIVKTKKIALITVSAVMGLIAAGLVLFILLTL